MSKLAIDVSHWDGDINIKSWKHDRDCELVIVKAGGFESGLGRYTDSRFVANYNKAKACGLPVGIYYYSVAMTTEAARQDAKHLLGLLDGKVIDYPVYYDVEDKRQLAIGQRQLTDVIKTFCDAIQSEGYRAGVYIQGSAWLHSVYRAELMDYADWIAAWGRSWPSYAPQGEAGAWQQGTMRLSDGQVYYADVSGCTDLDWFCIDYAQAKTTKTEGKEADMAKQGTIARLMEIAYGDLGYYAPSDPEPGSKAGRYCATLMGEDWLRGPSTEVWWCNCWVSMVLDKSGTKCPGYPSQNTDLSWNGGAKTRAVSKNDIRRGDILIFDWNFASTSTDHVGFATASPKNGYVATIEGNVGNAVKEMVRPLSSIRYVVRPQYSDAAPAAIQTNIVTVKNPTQNGKKLDVDGIGGYNTIYELQAQLGTPKDGELSDQDRRWYEYFEGIVSVTFGEGGSKAVKTLQAKVGAHATGTWDEETSKAVQTWLQSKGYSVGRCGIDGRFGHDSVCALQQSLNDKAWA